MGRPIRVLVACGSGIATSAIAVKEVKEACEKANVPVTVSKCTIMEMVSKAPGVDVIFVTNNYKGTLSIPVMNVTGFITGIGKQKTVEKVQNLIREINEKINWAE